MKQKIEPDTILKERQIEAISELAKKGNKSARRALERRGIYLVEEDSERDDRGPTISRQEK